MRTLRLDRLPIVPAWWLNRCDCTGRSLGLVRNQVAGKDLDHVFRCSYDGSHVESDVDRALQQPLLADLITSQPNSEERSDDGNGLDESFCETPTTSPDNSAFYTSRHLF